MLTYVSGIWTTVAGQWLAHVFHRRQRLREYLLEGYAELAGLAAEALERARDVQAVVECGAPAGDTEGHRERLLQLGEERRSLQRRLSAVCRQLRLLETDAGLRELVGRVCSSQPFFLLGSFDRPETFERFEKYRRSIAEYEKAVESLEEAVRARYGCG
jgi:hypothetical protein